jgi:hypothetical protein
MSARRADIALLAKAPANFLDATHFDIVRFPPPPWTAERFAALPAVGISHLRWMSCRSNPLS